MGGGSRAEWRRAAKSQSPPSSGSARELLTIAQIAAELQEHPRTTFDRVLRGEFGDPINLGSNNRHGRRYRIERDAFDRFLESRRIISG